MLSSASHEKSAQMHGAPRPGNLFGSFAYKPPGGAPGKAPLNLVGSRSLAQSQSAPVQHPSLPAAAKVESNGHLATTKNENAMKQENSVRDSAQKPQDTETELLHVDDGDVGSGKPEQSDEWHVRDKHSHAEGAGYAVAEIVKQPVKQAPVTVATLPTEVKQNDSVREATPASSAVPQTDLLEDEDADNDVTGFQRKGAKRKLASILSSPDENSPPVPTKRAPTTPQQTSVIDLTSDGDEAKTVQRPSDSGVPSSHIPHSSSTTALSDTVNLDGSTRSGSLPPRPGRLEGLGRLGGLGGLKMQAQRPVGLTAGPPLRMKLQVSFTYTYPE